MSVGIANEFERRDWPESADAQRYSSSFWLRKDGFGRGFKLSWYQPRSAKLAGVPSRELDGIPRHDRRKQ